MSQMHGAFQVQDFTSLPNLQMLVKVSVHLEPTRAKPRPIAASPRTPIAGPKAASSAVEQSGSPQYGPEAWSRARAKYISSRKLPPLGKDAAPAAATVSLEAAMAAADSEGPDQPYLKARQQMFAVLSDNVRPWQPFAQPLKLSEIVKSLNLLWSRNSKYSR